MSICLVATLEACDYFVSLCVSDAAMQSLVDKGLGTNDYYPHGAPRLKNGQSSEAKN